MYNEKQFISDYNSLLVGYNLSPDQETAVKTISGPVLVSAGPGSGKTETLVARTLRLIIVDKVPPQSIVLTTFTRKAARQMLDRLSQRLIVLKSKYPKIPEIQRAELQGIRLGTVHSIAEELLSEVRSANFVGKTVIDEMQLQMLMLNTGNGQNVYCGNTHPLKIFNKTYFGKPLFGEGWVRRLSLLFNHLTEDRIDYKKLLKADPSGGQALLDAYAWYKTIMHDSRRLDFALLLDLLLYEIEQGNMDSFLKQIHYVMVDEYQDTNPIQEEIFFRLARNSNLCVVGDDDQSLYRFRGASVECMVSFPSECLTRFKTGHTGINLIENYRSHPSIVDFYEKYMNSQSSINAASYRLRSGGIPALVPKGAALSSAPAVLLAQGANEIEADNALIDIIVGLKHIVDDWSQVAILSPGVNEDRVRGVGYLANQLEKKRISVYNPRGKDMSDTVEVKALYGLISLVIDTADEWKIDLAGDYNKETRKWMGECRSEASNLVSTYPDVAKYLAAAHATISAAPKDTSFSIMNIVFHILNLTPFTDWATDIASSWRLAQASNWIEGYSLTPSPKTTNPALQNIFVDGGAVSDYHINRFYVLASQAISEGRTVEHEEEDEIVLRGYLSIMTFHQAKGLEFDIVIVRGLYSTNSPHARLAAVMHGFFAPLRIRPLPGGPGRDTLRDFDAFRSYFVAFSRAKHALILHDPDVWKGLPNERGYHGEDQANTRSIVRADPNMEVYR